MTRCHASFPEARLRTLHASSSEISLSKAKPQIFGKRPDLAV